jgi:hypothetical protein
MPGDCKKMSQKSMSLPPEDIIFAPFVDPELGEIRSEAELEERLKEHYKLTRHDTQEAGSVRKKTSTCKKVTKAHKKLPKG